MLQKPAIVVMVISAITVGCAVPDPIVASNAGNEGAAMPLTASAAAGNVYFYNMTTTPLPFSLNASPVVTIPGTPYARAFTPSVSAGIFRVPGTPQAGQFGSVNSLTYTYLAMPVNIRININSPAVPLTRDVQVFLYARSATAMVANVNVAFSAENGQTLTID